MKSKGFTLLYVPIYSINTTYLSPALVCFKYNFLYRKMSKATCRLQRAWLNLYENPPSCSITAQQHSPVIAYLFDGLMYSMWPTFEGQLARLQSRMRITFALYCTLHEILTPIRASHQIVISSSGVDEWGVLITKSDLIYNDNINEKRKK